MVGVNRWTETEPSPLSLGNSTFLAVDEASEREAIQKLGAWRRGRDNEAVATALAELERAAREGLGIMEPSIVCAKVGVTTGEWGGVLREVFGEYRAPTGLGDDLPPEGNASECAEPLRARIEGLKSRLGGPLRMLVGKPGLDGHSNGAEQIAVRARAYGIEVVYEGIRFTPEQIVQSAADARVHVVGLSIHSGSHMPLVRDVLGRMREKGLGEVPVVVGGIIPPADAGSLKALGVAAIYTPKNFQLDTIIDDIVGLVERASVKG